jgi:small subunit ribosomal protein S9
MSKQTKEIIGVGRRKTAVASVWLRRGTGKVLVNQKDLKDYFHSEEQKNTVLSPIVKCSAENQYDLVIRVTGGGLEAQAVAARLGLSRALVEEDEDRRPTLKAEGYLTRDPRKKERKKYGQPGARKRFQFSKR